MSRLKPAARPSVSLLELNSKQIVDFVKPAIHGSGLAVFVFKLKRNDGIGRNRYFDFKASA